jgi:hypothetical protein
MYPGGELVQRAMDRVECTVAICLLTLLSFAKSGVNFDAAAREVCGLRAGA